MSVTLTQLLDARLHSRNFVPVSNSGGNGWQKWREVGPSSCPRVTLITVLELVVFIAL